jgi:hypothetical protein
MPTSPARLKIILHPLATATPLADFIFITDIMRVTQPFAYNFRARIALIHAGPA